MSTLRNSRRVPSETGRKHNGQSPETRESEIQERAHNGSPLGYQQRQDLEDQIKILESQIAGEDISSLPMHLQEHVTKVNQNPKGMQFRLRLLKNLLANGTPDIETRHDRAAIEKRTRELGERLSSMMVPDEFTHLTRGVDYRKAVSQMATKENSKEFQEMATEWKYNQRKLNPEDPNAEDLENIRPRQKAPNPVSVPVAS